MSLYIKVALAVLALCMIAPATSDVDCQLYNVGIQFDPTVERSFRERRDEEIHCVLLDESNETFTIGERILDLLPDGVRLRDNPIVNIVGASLDRENATITLPLDGRVNVRERSREGRRAELPILDGERTVLSVRINAVDRSTSATLSELSDSVFGTDGDPVNLKTQFEECSVNQLRFVPYTGTTITGQVVSNGVGEVSILDSVTRTDEGRIRNLALLAVLVKYGPIRQFDHVMLCLPPGTVGSWVAYAYVNFAVSVYNDLWCTYMSAQVHEIGHNLALSHSNEDGVPYEDQTGLLGYSYAEDDGPRMCFNGAKNWQLGWYVGCYAEGAASGEGASVLLVGAADYEQSTKCSTNEAVVIKVLPPSTPDSGHLYLSYNKKVGANDDTREAGNMVTVHFTDEAGVYADSELMAKVDEGDEAVVDGLYVRFCTATSDGKAHVRFGSSTNSCPPPPGCVGEECNVNVDSGAARLRREWALVTALLSTAVSLLRRGH